MKTLLRLGHLLGMFSSLILPLSAQTLSTLYSFSGGADGQLPEAEVIQGTDGNYYGTTSGSETDYGTVFKMTPTGTLTTLHTFDGTDGSHPYGGLVQGTDGDFYGTTSGGGANGDGTVFKINSTGTLTMLHSFNGADGANPIRATLVQATDGNFYGTTASGGPGGFGTLFKITPAGKLTTLHNFKDETDGWGPWAGLLQATDGNLYGTTIGGANPFGGTVFRITRSGTLTTLHNFNYTDGAYPYAGLVQGSDGNFYGTTRDGGTNRAGTIFKITPNGKLTALHNFNYSDGYETYAGLVQGTDGNFYGTTSQGGAYCFMGGGCGTVFMITPSGTLITLHSFDAGDGDQPLARLVQGTDGDFYGTTLYGGADGDGTVFSLAVGLAPFVKTTPTSGKVGASVIILGTDLTGATRVRFDGIAATFTVVSNSEVTTNVPVGAKTGTVGVTTPSGTLKSNLIFRVTPQVTKFTPTSGPDGTVVTIKGVSFTQTTRITFGDIKATSFTVNSDTQVTVTVPTGAKTGKITVSTAGGTATSSTNFTVTP